MRNGASTPLRTVLCENCPLRGIEILREFTPEQLVFVSGFKSGELRAEPGTQLFQEGTNSPHLYTVLSGWAFRHKTLADGRRQILNYVLPGDFIGLQGTLLNGMHHSIEALSNVVLCVFPREKLWTLYQDHPSLAYDVTWLAAREERMLDENLLSVGRRTAIERAAYMLIHLYKRAERLGLARGNSVWFPFTQQHVADTLGLSLVHTNKTLRRLVATKAMRWKDRTFELLDQAKLMEIAGYDAEAAMGRPFI